MHSLGCKRKNLAHYARNNKRRFWSLSQIKMPDKCYSPLVWMFYDRTLNHRINRIHERALRFAYKDFQADCGSLLKQRNLVSIHVKNLQLLMTEIYKTRSGLSPPFMKDIFAERNTGYNLRHSNDSQLPKVHTTRYGIETICFVGNRLWLNLPNIIKEASTLSIFNSHIKCWKDESCKCRHCKLYIPQVGYLTYVSIFILHL